MSDQLPQVLSMLGYLNTQDDMIVQVLEVRANNVPAALRIHPIVAVALSAALALQCQWHLWLLRRSVAQESVCGRSFLDWEDFGIFCEACNDMYCAASSARVPLTKNPPEEVGLPVRGSRHSHTTPPVVAGIQSLLCQEHD
eukprot:757725-Amphidinium_carterae.4